ncbi:V-type ATP synthase subunit F [Candidatus Solincola tengchongensis]|uniref:V-type ATP synthase subunit F n=1 Tax=Candidatus Solincola tengchongensis TaxID=2900693 RepID=UPI00257CF671|nr:V-type ATP synthase subunit F [Candidatus Solincola tengchongensis]
MSALRMAMIGGRTSTLGFKAVGVETFVAPLPEDGPRIWRELDLRRYAVVMVTEPVFEVLEREIPGFPPQGGLPVVLVVPAVTGTRETAAARLRERIVKAVGADLER